MPVVSDATALVALGSVGRIDHLRQFDPNLFISSWVRQRMLRAFAGQIDAAVAAGWLTERTPSRTVVEQLIAVTELDQGEAESIVLVGELNLRNSMLLLDEGPAFRWVDRHRRRPPKFELICLGQVIHQLQERDAIASATALIHELVTNGYYHWAPSVRRYHEDWCQRTGRTPLPRA